MTSDTSTGDTEQIETCQGCGREFDLRQEGYYVDTVDVGPDATGGTAYTFREDAEKFGEWLGFEEDDIGPWCQDCSWKIQRKRTRNNRSADTDTDHPGDADE